MICIILLGLIAGYREVIHLCQRGSWSFKAFRSWFWFTDQNNKKVSNWDSFHVSSGVFALIMMCAIYAQPEFMSLDFLGELVGIAYILILWVLYMWARNVCMHIILKRKPMWWYLVPLFGGYLDSKLRK